jgi:8-oxo-dGTP pyrophosphatase MutT (NUDIX family)
MRAFGDPPLLLMERAAIPLFGVRACGVHLNGFVRGERGVAMWIGRRSRDKPTSPGKLDQLVAGGQPAGMGLRENLIKECWEEAGIPLETAQRVVPVGAISYCLEVPQGLRSDVIFNFDLELPADFVPLNRDGEMEDFYLWPMEKVIETVRDTREFKPNCALVVIDFLIRHGFIPPDHPDYLQIIAGLMNRDVLLADLSA